MSGVSEEVAQILLKLKAVTLNPSKPYRYASGILSPIYTDCRVIIAYPQERRRIRDLFIENINAKGKFDVIAGTATAGIPHAAWIADTMDLPMIYVRGKAKDHGKENLVEGILKDGQKVAVIEDLVSTGESSINSVKAIKAAGGNVSNVFSIINYNLKIATENFETNNLHLHSLTDFGTLLIQAAEMNYITAKEKELIFDWIKDPLMWGKRNNYE